MHTYGMQTKNEVRAQQGLVRCHTLSVPPSLFQANVENRRQIFEAPSTATRGNSRKTDDPLCLYAVNVCWDLLYQYVTNSPLRKKKKMKIKPAPSATKAGRRNCICCNVASEHTAVICILPQFEHFLFQNSNSAYFLNLIQDFFILFHESYLYLLTGHLLPAHHF